MAVRKHTSTLFTHSIGVGYIYVNTPQTHLSPAEHAWGRQGEGLPPSGDSREKQEKSKEREEAGLVKHESKHPCERATYYTSCFFPKNEVEKILEIYGQQTVTTHFCLAC